MAARAASRHFDFINSKLDFYATSRANALIGLNDDRRMEWRLANGTLSTKLATNLSTNSR
jgi:hypothetical protein